MTMMEGRPIKFRLLEIYSESSPWNYEVVKKLQIEYDMKSDYGRDCINWDIAEIAAGGMLKQLDIKMDDDGSLYGKPDSLCTKYTISNIGKEYLSSLKANLHHKKNKEV